MCKNFQCRAALAAFFVAWLTVADAEAKCAPRAEFVERLKRDFDEHVALVGVRDGGASVIEFFVSKDGSWTILESFPSGRACSRAHGKSWFHVPPERGHGT